MFRSFYCDIPYVPPDYRKSPRHSPLSFFAPLASPCGMENSFLLKYRYFSLFLTFSSIHSFLFVGLLVSMCLCSLSRCLYTSPIHSSKLVSSLCPTMLTLWNYNFDVIPSKSKNTIHGQYASPSNSKPIVLARNIAKSPYRVILVSSVSRDAFVALVGPCHSSDMKLFDSLNTQGKEQYLSINY